MIGKILATLRTIDYGPMLAVAMVMLGLSELNGYVQQRQERLADLDLTIAARSDRLRAILSEMGQAMGAEAKYPAPVDVDPLDRAEPAAASLA